MVFMHKDIIIARLVDLMRKDDLLFKTVVSYVDAAYNGCLTAEELWQKKEKKQNSQ